MFIWGRKMIFPSIKSIIRKKHTIYALSSGFGKCGVAVVRISGPNAQTALKKMCRRLPPPRSAELKKIRDPETNQVLDHGLVLWFPAPASFTGEDSCEFQVHGGPAVLTSIFTALAKLDGFRPAEPGEFTKRAFYGGKLDLTSIEGLADLINAETEYQRRQAVIQMEGALCQVYSSWRNSLSRCLANIEAYIDFAEDQDIDSDVLVQAKNEMEQLRLSIARHLTDGRRGERLRQGVNMTIIGAPNVGKSSLLNLLSKKPTAIVSDIPGTTRDIIKTNLDICGFPVNVHDTAGLREGTSDVVELEGMSRARKTIDATDIIIIVIDSRTFTKPNNSLSKLLTYINSLGVASLSDTINSNCNRTQKFMIVINKIDLTDKNIFMDGLKTKFENNVCPISCKTEEGVDNFMTNLSLHLKDLCGNPSLENPSFTQPRHRFCLEETLEALNRFDRYTDVEIDLAAQEVRSALHSLGKITGHVTTEDILDIIFKEFCIGK